MRPLWIALALIAASAGCLGPPTVRTALVTESFAFDERAPPEAMEALEYHGCRSGTYDPTNRTVTLARMSEDMTPNFVMIMHRDPGSTGPGGAPDPQAGVYTPMSAGGGRGWPNFEPVRSWIAERGSMGGWGHGTPFHTQESVELEWDKTGATFEGEKLRQGAFVNKTFVHEVTQYNTTFGVTQTFSATYLGKVRYTLEAPCGSS